MSGTESVDNLAPRSKFTFLVSVVEGDVVVVAAPVV